MKMNNDKFLEPKWPQVNSNIPHDWMKYVSQDVREIWLSFTVSQRVTLGRCFEDIASLEEWD